MDKKVIRCAIYTRKSSEEGLEQDFNSLDAQREACEAYIKSQMHERWILFEKQYNDGGFSGGTMERPAFKELLKDIGNDEIDIVVVYKVDRLTRSLMDFSKIIDVFDKHKTSFVSITQQFNTTTSMGRLTLNKCLVKLKADNFIEDINCKIITHSRNKIDYSISKIILC